jgi:Glycosyltransferase
MRIAFVTSYNSEEIGHWSGLGYYMAKCLEQQGMELIRINCSVPFTPGQRIKRKLIWLCYRKIQQPERDHRFLQKMAEEVKRQLQGQDYDLVFAAGSLPVSYLESGKPVVFFTDATYEGLISMYINRRKLCNQSLVQGNRAEANALQNASLVLYTSEWAIRQAVTMYGADAAKMRQLPFGPNLVNNIREQDLNELIARRTASIKKNFLFIGVDWFRKGACIAIDTISKLNEMGIPSTITIVGCRLPKNKRLPSFVEYHPFISKNDARGVQLLAEMYRKAHFFLLPTQADCTPVVFSEAASFGIPVITTNVGGCNSVVLHNETGFCLNKNNFVAEATHVIATLCYNENLYELFCRRAFYHYKNELNWEAIGKKAAAYLQQVLHHHHQPALST